MALQFFKSPRARAGVVAASAQSAVTMIASLDMSFDLLRI
jgi:hypothetical protein